MNTIDEMTEPQKAWLVWKKLDELNTLLWETYCHEFQQLDKEEEQKRIAATNLPF